MKKINVLSKEIYNRIAAGEVVDRPYSAVKELIENSIDAGATEIEIYIEKGGKQLIKVVDNGAGVEREDLPAAFMPHATSKIAKADDLDDIKTLGFRGEALASISVISRAEIISVTAGNSAYKISCEGGAIGEVQPAALVKGTEIYVRNLFYNTPVRAKFLKADKKEETDITSFVTRYILGNPEICFKYFVDGKLTLQSFGGGAEEAVAQVYGAKTISQCFKIDAEKDGIRVRGFIGNQNFFKSNKSYQSVFLNGRYIVNNTIATAVSQAYASYAMKRQYPFYVLFIDMPSEIVDVNVHPNKADVRFIDNRMIFGAVYKIISSILDGTASAAEFVLSGSRLPEMRSTAFGKEEENRLYSIKSAEVAPKEPVQEDFEKLIEKYKPALAEPRKELKEEKSEPPKVPERDYYDPAQDMPIAQFIERAGRNSVSVSDKTAIPDINNDTLYGRAKAVTPQPKQQSLELSSFVLKGNLFNTYLIYEYGDSVYIIDQHAAHERLIFDEYNKKVAQRKIARQPLLVPYFFEVNAVEGDFIERKRALLDELGFSIDQFGFLSYRVSEVPADLQSIDIGEFIDDFLTLIDDLKDDFKLDEMFKDKIAMAACKHAVKGGMALTEQECKALFDMLDGNLGLKCPHGRPICTTLTKRDIEKLFKRIV